MALSCKLTQQNWSKDLLWHCMCLLYLITNKKTSREWEKERQIWHRIYICISIWWAPLSWLGGPMLKMGFPHFGFATLTTAIIDTCMHTHREMDTWKLNASNPIWSSKEQVARWTLRRLHRSDQRPLEVCCRPWTWWCNDATALAGYATTMTMIKMWALNACAQLQCTYGEVWSIRFCLHLTHLSVDSDAIIFHRFRDFARIWIFQQHHHACSSISFYQHLWTVLTVVWDSGQFKIKTAAMESNGVKALNKTRSTDANPRKLWFIRSTSRHGTSCHPARFW